MKLNDIEINNYRSIKAIKLNIEDISASKLSILFGVNETGKTNILKAISLINDDAGFKYSQDCEKVAFKQDEKVSISCHYTIESDDHFYTFLRTLPLPESLSNSIKIDFITKIIEYDSASNRTETLYLTFSGISFSDYFLNRDELIVYEKSDLGSLGLELEDLDEQNLDELLWESFVPLVKTLQPKVIFWKSAPEYLINKPINLDEFQTTPNTSIPLKNIFSLAGYNGDSLKKLLSKIKVDTDERSTIEETLSETVTEHINKLWPDHNINIKLRIEGNVCTVSIEDKDNKKQKFSMEQRSDGFKHFISILLTLSAENMTKQLVNNIILLDEPENSLHPSSIKYLLSELLNIGKRNVIFVASHSIFMVDRKNLNRHFTVSKQENHTTVERIDPENPMQEEVIYEALGTSLYEIIEPNVLIFEGRTDKDLFDNFTAKLKTKIKPAKIKSISATGAEKIPRYAKFFNTLLVKGIIVVDSDQDGREAKRLIGEQSCKVKPKTFEINDLVQLPKANSTLEDLLPIETIAQVATSLYDYQFMLNDSLPVIDQIKRIKRENNINKDQKLEDFKTKVVFTIMSDLKKLNISATETKYHLYIDFLNALHTKIKEP